MNKNEGIEKLTEEKNSIVRSLRNKLKEMEQKYETLLKNARIEVLEMKKK